MRGKRGREKEISKILQIFFFDVQNKSYQKAVISEESKPIFSAFCSSFLNVGYSK